MNYLNAFTNVSEFIALSAMATLIPVAIYNGTSCYLNKNGNKRTYLFTLFAVLLSVVLSVGSFFWSSEYELLNESCFSDKNELYQNLYFYSGWFWLLTIFIPLLTAVQVKKESKND